MVDIVPESPTPFSQTGVQGSGFCSRASYGLTTPKNSLCLSIKVGFGAPAADPMEYGEDADSAAWPLGRFYRGSFKSREYFGLLDSAVD